MLIGLGVLVAMPAGMVLVDHAGRAESPNGESIGYSLGQFFGIVGVVCAFSAVLDVLSFGRLPQAEWNLLTLATMVPGAALFGGFFVWVLKTAAAKGQQTTRAGRVPGNAPTTQTLQDTSHQSRTRRL